jgi:plasmid stabilization system protein ParE
VNAYSVLFAPEAESSLVALYDYIAEHGSPAVAERYVSAIVAYCESLARCPRRGTRRDEIRPGLRVTNYKRRTVIAFAFDETNEKVIILGIFYAGRDYERALGETDDW